MSEQREELAEARQLGRFKAERLDSSLRAAEQRERELCFARLLWEGIGADPTGPASQETGDRSAEVWRLRQDVERLAAFHHAVERSRAWRVVQWARRPFGRAW